MTFGINEPLFKYYHQAAGATTSAVGTNVHANTSGSPLQGTLNSVTFNTVGATPSVVTLVDGFNNGSSLTTVSNLAVITPPASSVPFTLNLEVQYTTGLVIVCTTASNTSDITVSYS
jgi:hypothetical protein